MKNRLFFLLAYLVLSLSLTGCWDYVEYENLTQVIGIGVDYDSQTQESTVTIQYPSLRGGTHGAEAAKQSQWVTQSATAKTFANALIKLQETTPNRLFYGYLRVIVIGEEAAKYNLMETIDFAERTPAIRSSADLVIAAGRAEDALKTIQPSRRQPASDDIHDLIQESKRAGSAYPVTLTGFVQMLAIGGWEASAPRVMITGPTQPDLLKDAKGGTQGNIRFDEERIGGYRVAGLAAFKGDHWIGWLEEKDSLGLSFIVGKKIDTYKVSDPAGGVSDNELYYRLIDSKSKIKARLENGHPVIDVNVKVVADIRKYYRTDEGGEFLSAEVVRDAENKLADNIRSDIEAALTRGQKELKSDIFGFGFAFFQEYPLLWRDEYEAKWEDVFPDLQVNVVVEASIINTGITIRKLIIK